MSKHKNWLNSVLKRACPLTAIRFELFNISLLGLLLSLAVGISPAAYSLPLEIVTPQLMPSLVALSTLPDATRDSNFVTQTIAKEGAAVVQINVSRTLGREVPDFLKPFFGAPSSSPYGRTLSGIGSGFVISTDGKIITNAHVVNNADTVSVSFADGRIFDGQVLGKDPVTDVAVIQIEGDNLTAVTLGDSDRVQQGQWAIAIGNPLGLQETVTVGVISATQRFGPEIGVPDKRIGFIQTDAAINPGNSGGPLFNENGEVIGVNSAVIGGTQGLGFAIPINTAQQVAQQIITKGQVEHPYIGVQMVSLTPQVKQQINQLARGGIQVEAERGILIVDVARRSPAAQAGLRPGDVVEKINAQEVLQANEVQQLIDQTGLGGKLEIGVLRNGQPVEATVQPKQLPTQT